MLDLAGLFLRLELVGARQELVLVNNMTIDFIAIDTGVRLCTILPGYYFATAGLVFFVGFSPPIGTIL